MLSELNQEYKDLVFFPMKPGPCIVLPFSLTTDWVWEPKYDGWHTLFAVHRGRVRVFSRNLKMELTDWPGLRETIAELENNLRCFTGTLVGELLASSGISTDVMKARSGVKVAPKFFDLVMPAFDMVPLYERRRMLLDLPLPRDWFAHQACIESQKVLEQTFRMCKDTCGMEGVVIKKFDSLYERSNTSPVVAYSWLKIK